LLLMEKSNWLTIKSKKVKNNNFEIIIETK